MFFHRTLLLLLATAIATNIAGCTKKNGRPLAPVNGKVTYEGKPLKFGTVIFVPESGQWSRGVIQADGTFQMETPGEGLGAVVGKNRIRVRCVDTQDPASKRSENNPAGVSIAGKPLIPKKYLACETSGLVVDVHLDRNPPVTLELTD